MRLQFYRLVVEDDDNSKFRWLPVFEMQVEREAFWQDYCNYYWFLSVFWLWWNIDVTWQKSYHG